MAHALRKTLLSAGIAWLAACACAGQPGGHEMVLLEYHNREVTALVEDSETVRLALGAAWDDALACRAMSGYLRPWADHASPETAEGIAGRGARLYERVKCVDDGINSVRLVRDARDAKDEPQLVSDLKFWGNELALAAREVVDYATEAASLRSRLEKHLRALAADRKITARQVDAIPWADAPREAWRKAGPATGVRLPLEPWPGSYPEWWNRHLSLAPAYLAAKLHSVGNLFFTDETPLGAWGHNCPTKGQYDWSRFDRVIGRIRDCGGKVLLELPTLVEHRTEEQIAAAREQALRRGWYLMLPTGYAPSLPGDLCRDAKASLVARDEDGTLRPHGSVQLFDPDTARAYGEYLQAMAAHLKSQGLDNAVAALHLEMGDAAELPESVDYSERTRARWAAFLKDRYGQIGALNRAASTSLASFDQAAIPYRAVPAQAAQDWQECLAVCFQRHLVRKYKNIKALNDAAGTAYAKFEEVKVDRGKPADAAIAADWKEFRAAQPQGNDWMNFLLAKYKPAQPGSKDPQQVRDETLKIIRKKLGDDYQDGYHARLPHDYPPVLKTDYLHFRRAWVREYLAIKRKLVEAAFPGKLVIAEMWQVGDHDGVQGKGERKWGGFLDDDYAQFSGTGADNQQRPFLLRSVGPPGFGSRPSDSLESLFRDYLWLHFRDPGNLTRYFYHWVAHGYMDYQLGWHSVTNHWLTNRLMYRLGPTVANTSPEPQRIGLLLPRTTLDLFDGASYYPYMGWDWVLHAAKLPYTRIDEHLVRDGRLASLGLEVLILPEVCAMDDRVAHQIQKWVAAGGLLVASTVPGRLDAYGRPRPQSPLAAVLGVTADGTVSEPIRDTPLEITIPHGHYSGRWAESTSRRPEFEVFKPTSDKAKVLAAYAGGKPAIVLNQHGKGRAVTLGYPFGREAVECERTSIGFQRTYVWFVREPQLVARVDWLRNLLTRQLGYRPDYGVDHAEVARFKGNEAIAPGLHLPGGLSQDPASPDFARTFGDPRPGHEMVVDRESPDLALRFFPRHRPGLATHYVGISTREVHYLGPRATVNMFLMRHSYRCRINNPRIEAVWDVERDVPVGFQRDAHGVCFDVSLPSGHIMMLAISETPTVDLFSPAPLPGRDKPQVLHRCRVIAGGTSAPPVVILTAAADLREWLQELAQPSSGPRGKQPARKETILISYGHPANKPAAERLSKAINDRFGIVAESVQQCVTPAEKPDSPLKGFEAPVILIGDEWTNNDMAMHGAYWGIAYGAHLPFTATYAWPGAGRAVVALSRRYALIDENGRHPFAWNSSYALRPVQRTFPLVRRKLHVAANGPDAERAVDAILAALDKR